MSERERERESALQPQEKREIIYKTRGLHNASQRGWKWPLLLNEDYFDGAKTFFFSFSLKMAFFH